MTNPTNWPNPERPGVPMFPERSGLHAIRTSLGTEFLVNWDHANGRLFNLSGASVPIERLPKLSYIGPVLTPTQIAELLAGERERCAKECDAIATFASSDWKATAYDSDNRAGDAAEETAEICAQKIRNLGAAP